VCRKNFLLACYRIDRLIQLAKPDEICLVLTGDGSMLMQGPEIQTAGKYDIPVIFIVFDNSQYGKISCDLKGNENYENFSRLPEHNWKKFSESLGVASETVSSIAAFELTLNKAIEMNTPFLIHAICNVYDLFTENLDSSNLGEK